MHIVQVVLLAASNDHTLACYVVAHKVLVVELNDDLVLIARSIVVHPAPDLVVLRVQDEAADVQIVVKRQQCFGLEAMHSLFMVVCLGDSASVDLVAKRYYRIDVN